MFSPPPPQLWSLVATVTTYFDSGDWKLIFQNKIEILVDPLIHHLMDAVYAAHWHFRTIRCPFGLVMIDSRGEGFLHPEIVRNRQSYSMDFSQF